MNLNVDGIEHLFQFIDYPSKLNVLIASDDAYWAFINSSKLLREFVLHLDASNFNTISKCPKVTSIPLKYISISLNDSIKIISLLKFLKTFRSTLENLELISLNLKGANECIQIFNSFLNLKILKFKNCKIRSDLNTILPAISSLTSIKFEKCDANFLKIFSAQPSLERIGIWNDEFTWNGFSHENFNSLMQNSPNIRHIELIGAGTGSYFDSDDFPYKITSVETSMITFHWYVGIRTARINFLELQRGYLKELTIHQLPYDFDGGKVLKYIIEAMGLVKFFYRQTPLILQGRKQHVKKFSANQIQIQSIYEMFRQFPSIETFELNLSPTDIASDEIEKIINVHSTLFVNLDEFVVVDESLNRGIFGVFLGFYKLLKNIRKVTFHTQDRNINVILRECLPYMKNLETICIPSTAARAEERFEIIKTLAMKLSQLTVASQFVMEAKEFFGPEVEVNGI